MFTLTSAPAVVKSASPLAFADPVATIDSAVAQRERLEADYRAYGDWLDANAAELEAEAEVWEMYENGHPAW